MNQVQAGLVADMDSIGDVLYGRASKHATQSA